MTRNKHTDAEQIAHIAALRERLTRVSFRGAVCDMLGRATIGGIVKRLDTDRFEIRSLQHVAVYHFKVI